jgi:hypothetical protein
MANIGYVFDSSTVEPRTPFEVLPAGDYVGQIVKSDMVPTKTGNGNMLNLEIEILNDGFSGRRVWDRLNLDNPNAQAVEIAQRTLSAICRAVGVVQVSDSEQLHFKPFALKVIVLPAGKDPKTGYERREPQNEVRGYEPAGGAPVAQAPRPVMPVAPAAASGPVQGARASAPRTQAPATSSAPPWARRAPPPAKDIDDKIPF